jgi:hypothetical protein
MCQILDKHMHSDAVMCLQSHLQMTKGRSMSLMRTVLAILGTNYRPLLFIWGHVLDATQFSRYVNFSEEKRVKSLDTHTHTHAYVVALKYQRVAIKGHSDRGGEGRGNNTRLYLFEFALRVSFH